jgi:hypothetical protein
MKHRSADREKATAFDDHPPDEWKGTLKAFGGSRSDDWNNILTEQTLEAVVLKSDKKACAQQFGAIAAGLMGVAPKDELEGMMAAQLLAAHNATMDCYRRATLAPTVDERQEHLNQAIKLSRTYALLLDALNRHRGKGQQKVTVEHVHVHAGGQAVVGMVGTPGGGPQPKSKEQPHAITYAPGIEMPSPQQERSAVPSTRDAERPLPDARRNVAGRPEG